MECRNVRLSCQQCMELGGLVIQLVNHYQTENIICFASLHESLQSQNCMTDTLSKQEDHYFLLVITTELTRIEHQIQDYVNQHHPQSRTTIIAHGLEIVIHAIQEGSRFFSTVCKEGIYLHGSLLEVEYPQPDWSSIAVKAERHYHHRHGLATGFLLSATACLNEHYYNNAIFLLHQSIEQCCIGMIRVCLAYRSDMHKLSRLLNICLCFSPEPQNLFPRNTTEEQRLFRLLEKSYSDARYRDVYLIEPSNAQILLIQVASFLKLLEAICLERIKQYQKKTEAVEALA